MFLNIKLYSCAIWNLACQWDLSSSRQHAFACIHMHMHQNICTHMHPPFLRIPPYLIRKHAMIDPCLKVCIFSLWIPWSWFASHRHAHMHLLCCVIILEHVTNMWSYHVTSSESPTNMQICPPFNRYKNIIIHESSLPIWFQFNAFQSMFFNILMSLSNACHACKILTPICSKPCP